MAAESSRDHIGAIVQHIRPLAAAAAVTSAVVSSSLQQVLLRSSFAADPSAVQILLRSGGFETPTYHSSS